MKINKKAFTLVELIVVITILAILATIAFISLSWYTKEASNSKILYDVRNLTKVMEIRLSRWGDLDNLVLNDRTSINWVNETLTVSSGAYVLSALTYEVWTFDFGKMKINWSDFVYDDKWDKREYMFGYVKTPVKLFYEFAGQVMNQAWKYDVIISWNYFDISSTDTKWLISENWENIWLENWNTLTWSLY